jgi:hypothetical protein
MSDDRKAGIVCWAIAIGKVALIFGIAVLLLALAGAADHGHL